jgi:DNA mismatch endonuclease (patch repair protein)
VKSPSFRNLQPASNAASAAGKGASLKRDTKPELRLRQGLWRRGFRYRTNVPNLPGIPDIIFGKAKVAIFCDGDFWHGKDWQSRKTKLRKGTNAEYWIAKIEHNMKRDRINSRALQKKGWTVLRFWESEIQHNIHSVLSTLISALTRNADKV